MPDILKKITYFFLITHVFIALTAVALALETNIILGQPFAHFTLYLFIFISTHFAYNVYYIRTSKASLYRPLSLLSFLICIAVLFLVPAVYHVKLFLISIASGIYIFPLFFSFKKDRSFTIQKLLLLILIWTAATFVLPASLIYDYKTIVYLIYRIVFISSACLLFFIRDEKTAVYRRKAILVNYILTIIQILLALLILFTVHTGFGCIFLFTALVSLCVVVRFLSNNYEAVYYLAFADGILFLQGMLVIVYYYLNYV